MLDDIKKTLLVTTDKLRANMDAVEFKHLAHGLIFAKYVSETFTASRAELTTRLTKLVANCYLPEVSLAHNWKTSAIPKRARRNAFWVPKAARFPAIPPYFRPAAMHGVHEAMQATLVAA